MKDRKDQLAMVTGAAGDIGRAIAAALSESHAK
ncbi:short-chain dehydrogenase, partial [Mesorhizobium sp. M4B.F.Ca.ET.190.01.1.1]